MLFIIICLTVGLIACEKRTELFTGQASDVERSGVANANVKINCVTERRKVKTFETKTDERGNFSLKVTKADKYIVNFIKEDHAFVSKVFYETAQGISVFMAKTESLTINPAQSITLTDTKANCYSFFNENQQTFTKNPYAKVPYVYGASGGITDFVLPEQLERAYKGMTTAKLCATGATIKIKPGTLVRQNGQAPAGDIKVNITTVNLYSPDGMPGDYTVRTSSGFGYMVSYGAAIVSAYYKGEELKLKEGETAKLTIPVDQTLIASGEQIPDRIPFLIYDRDTGEWLEKGTADLDRKSMTYTREVDHFSEFNTDIVKTGGTCVRIDATLLGDAPVPPAVSNDYLKIVVPLASGGFAVKDRQIVNPGGCTKQHVIVRLPEKTPIGIIYYQNIAGNPIGGTYAIYTGTGSTAAGARFFSCSNYGICEPTASSPGSLGVAINYGNTDWNTDGVPDPNLVMRPWQSTPGATASSTNIAELVWAYAFTDPGNSNNEYQLYVSFWNGTSWDAYAPFSPASGESLTKWTNQYGGAARITSLAGNKTKFMVVATDDKSSCPLPSNPTSCPAAPCLCSNEIIIN